MGCVYSPDDKKLRRGEMVEFWIHYYHKALTFVSFELLTPTGRGFKVVKAKQIGHKNE